MTEHPALTLREILRGWFLLDPTEQDLDVAEARIRAARDIAARDARIAALEEALQEWLDMGEDDMDALYALVQRVSALLASEPAP